MGSKDRQPAGRWLAIAVAACIAASSVFAGERDRKSDDEKFSAGIEISDKALAEDTGLPPYPGATPDHRHKGDSDGVNLGLWGGSFGLKLVVVKLESPDGPEKVSAFYRDALSQYGRVLDCSKSGSAQTGSDRNIQPKPLSCDKDRGRKDGLLYKAGTRQKQHIVSIEPRGQGTAFQLLYLEKKWDD